MSRSLEDQIRGRCVHFNGTGNDACEAGIRYDEFRKMPRPFCFPCLRGGSFKGEEFECPKRRWPSDEEVKAELDEHAVHVKKFMAVGPLVRRIKEEHRGKSWGGVEECPVCKGRLHLSHAAYNGHIHGSCETPDCLRWME